jgi:hypothetical protein
MDASKVGDFAERVLLIRVDGDKLYALGFILGSQFGEPRAIALRQRALGSDKHDDHRFLIVPLAQ